MRVIEFRNADVKDLPLIVGTYNATVAGRMVTADLEPVSIESKKKWFENHNPETRPLLIVEVNQQYAGWISFTDFYGRPAYSKTAELSIYLESSMHGKGLGSYCLNHAIEKSPSLKITSLLGFIFGHNEPSLKLFYKHGFEKWAQLLEVADMEGVWRDLIIVGRKI